MLHAILFDYKNPGYGSLRRATKEWNTKSHSRRDGCGYQWPDSAVVDQITKTNHADG